MPFFIFRYAWTHNYLNHLTQVFLALLVLSGLYEAYFTLVVFLRLRFLRTIQDDTICRRNLGRLSHRSQNVGQMVLAMTYLFAVTFFIQLGSAYITPENSRPVGLMVLENLRVYSSFAATIFLIFLIFHSVQWFISGRVQKAMLRTGGERLHRKS